MLSSVSVHVRPTAAAAASSRVCRVRWRNFMNDTIFRVFRNRLFNGGVYCRYDSRCALLASSADRP